MKHAFIFGTNLYLSENSTVDYGDQQNHTQWLRVLSFYYPDRNKALVINAHIASPEGDPLEIDQNQLGANENARLKIAPNRVSLYYGDHHEPILDVFQLDRHEYEGLSSHILNELNVQHPDVVVTIKGHFKAGSGTIVIDSEKMYINGDSTANGVANAHHGIILSPDGSYT